MTTEPPALARLPDALLADRLGRDRLARRLQRDAPRGREPRRRRLAVAGHRRGGRPRGLRPGPLVVRRRAAAGQPLRRGPVEIPSPSELDDGQRRTAWTWPGPRSGVLAAAALGHGRLPGRRLAGHRPGRPRHHHDHPGGLGRPGRPLARSTRPCACAGARPTGIESVVLGCALTAVLAGVGLLARARRDGAGRPDRPRRPGRHAVRPRRLAPAGRARRPGRGRSACAVVAALSLILPIALLR